MPEARAGGASAAVDRTRAPEPGPLRPFHFPPIQRLELDNGVPLLVAHVPRLPLVTATLLLDAGGVREAPANAGLATLTSSLLESGAAGRSALQIAEVLETLGVRPEIATTWDSAQVGFTALASRAGEAMEVVADLVRRPDFPEPEVERLRGEQLADILQRRVEPRGLASEMISRYIFSEHSPFSRPLSGESETVGALGRDEVVDFHRTYYAPAVAQVVLAGDLDAEAARRLANERFGDWSLPAPPPTPIEVEPRPGTPRVVVVHREGAAQAEVRVGCVGVARDTPDYFPIAVMNTLLGGAFSSRLNLNLRERHGFTYGVTSAFVMRRRPGPFVVSTAVQTEVTAAAVTEILHEIRQIRQEPVSPAELDDARNYLAGTFPLRLQTTSGVASRLADLALHRLPLDYFDHYRERVLAVDAEQVLRAARTYLRPDELTVVVVADADQVRAPLEQLGLGEVEVVHAQQPVG